MKKMLFGYVAASCLIAGSLCAQGISSEPKNEPVELRTYTEEEDRILTAFEDFLYNHDMDETRHLDIKKKDDGYIITVKNPQDNTLPSGQIDMLRTGELSGNPQFAIKHTSWDKYKQQAEALLENDALKMGSFAEELLWVPNIGLKTKRSLNATDIQLKIDNVLLTIPSVAADMLVRPHGDKMDVAGITTVNGLKIITDYVVTVVPSIEQSFKINNAEITGDETLQVLTSGHAGFELSIPTISIMSPFLGTDTLSATFDSKGTFEEKMTFETTFSNIRATGQMAMMPLIPRTVTSNVTIEGISKDLIIAYAKMNEQFMQMDESEAGYEELEQKLVAAQNQILSSAVVNIHNASIENDIAGIKLTGTARASNSNPEAELKLAVTNFDLISPKQPPVDENACKAAMSVMPQGHTDLPPQCIPAQGLLEPLRTHLATAAHTKNAKGQPVDTFDIVYKDKTMRINGVIVMEPKPETPDLDEIASEAMAQVANNTPQAK